MSDIYLTKIERKTIFTKSLIFVLLLFIIADLTVIGPFYFNFIPWIFLIGIIGEVRAIDKILMGIISTFTVFVSTVIKDGGLTINTLLNVSATVALLGFGIIVGRLIIQFVLSHRLVKFVSKTKKVIYTLLIVVITILSFGIVSVKDTSVFEYITSRSSLNKYIKETYKITEYEVQEVIFNQSLKYKYAYNVKIDGQVVTFVQTIGNRFNDANMNERLIALNEKENKLLNEKIKSIDITKYTMLDGISVKIQMEYSKFQIKPDIKVMYISLNGITKVKDDVYNELADYIKEVTSLYDVNKVVVTLNNNSVEITKDKISKVNLSYLKGAFKVEELDG